MCHAQKRWNKMAGTFEGCCSSCFKTTKYTCLTCKEYFCMICSVFENDEDVEGWLQGSSVAYCEPCFREKMKKEMNSGDRADDPGNRKREKTCTSTTEELTLKRKRTDEYDDTDEEQEDEEKNSDEIDAALQLFVKKGKGANKKKSGRKSNWPAKALDDFIDIVVSSNSYKKNLIFTNSKNQKNGPIYEKILEELKARASTRGDVITFTVTQLRSKFKKCVGFCKQAALTQRTATGIKRFQDDHGFGNWFNALFEIVKTRDSCQPEQALEPSSTNSETSSPTSDALGEEGQVPLFVPVKNVKKRQTTKEKLDATTVEVLNLVKASIENDPTKELITFMREEMEKSRQHEIKLFQLMSSQRANSSYDSYQTIPSSGGIPFGETGYYPTWNGGFGTGPSNQLIMPDGSFGTASRAPMMPSNDSVYGTGIYQPL